MNIASRIGPPAPSENQLQMGYVSRARAQNHLPSALLKRRPHAAPRRFATDLSNLPTEPAAAAASRAKAYPEVPADLAPSETEESSKVAKRQRLDLEVKLILGERRKRLAAQELFAALVEAEPVAISAEAIVQATLEVIAVTRSAQADHDSAAATADLGVGRPRRVSRTRHAEQAGMIDTYIVYPVQWVWGKAAAWF